MPRYLQLFAHRLRLADHPEPVAGDFCARMSEEAFMAAIDHIPRDAQGNFIESQWSEESLSQAAKAKRLFRRKSIIRFVINLALWGAVIKLVIGLLRRHF